MNIISKNEIFVISNQIYIKGDVAFAQEKTNAY